MKKLIITRQQLYDMVWAESLSSIVKKYQLTYSELRKILADMVIPIPENGHWSKLKFGKQVEIKPLPEDYTGKNEVELFEKEIGDKIVSETGRNSNNADEEGTNNNTYRVPAKLTKPDILIVNTKEYFDAGSSFYWRHNHRFPEQNDVLDIDTTHKTFPRALRIMDTLIKILRDRGHDIEIKYGKTNAVIYGQGIEIKLREKQRVVDEPRGKYDSRNLEPTGILSFIIEYGHYNQKVINDGQDLLETKLEAILSKLEVEGARKKEEHIKNEEWHRQYQEKQRIEKEIREKKEKEISDFKLIFQRAFRLHHSNIIRGYISSVENGAKESGNVDDEMRTWINWAKEKVDWYDPLVNRMDDTLDDYDKTNIFREFLKEWN
jgi:hypothetical protein